MEFIKNHFYKLTKEIPVKQLSQIRSWYDVAAHNIYYGGYGSYTISYDGNGSGYIVSPYEPSKRFTVGGIYQAFSNTALYDDMGNANFIDSNEIECFEEVEIGLNEISKRFMEKHINSGKMEFQFNFLSVNIVVLKISLYGKYSTSVSLMGVMGQVNEMLYNAYIALRKTYIKNFITNLKVNYRWSTLMGGETCGTFLGIMQDT